MIGLSILSLASMSDLSNINNITFKSFEHARLVSPQSMEPRTLLARQSIPAKDSKVLGLTFFIRSPARSMTILWA